GKVCAVTARDSSPDRRALSDRHDAAVFSGLQVGPGAAPDPTNAEEIEARRLRLLAGAQSTINSLADVLSPLATAFGDAGHELYRVGSSVRDAVLARLGTCLAFTTDARPPTVRAFLASYAHTAWDTGIGFGSLSSAKHDASCIEQQIEITT